LGPASNWGVGFAWHGSSWLLHGLIKQTTRIKQLFLDCNGRHRDRLANPISYRIMHNTLQKMLHKPQKLLEKHKRKKRSHLNLTDFMDYDIIIFSCQ
jgi:hypothetical protein